MFERLMAFRYVIDIIIIPQYVGHATYCSNSPLTLSSPKMCFLLTVLTFFYLAFFLRGVFSHCYMCKCFNSSKII